MCVGKYQQWLEPEKLILLTGWARDGLTNVQIAQNMGIADSTLRDWANKYPAISAALKKGKEVADYAVENALFMKATGYTREEVVIDNKGEEHIIQKWYPPDTTAQIFWLKNRKPKVWRDRRDLDLSSEDKKTQMCVAFLPERTEIDDSEGR